MLLTQRKVKKQIEDVIGIDTSHSINCSGKTGEGVDRYFRINN